MYSFLLETDPKYITINDANSKIASNVTFIDGMDLFYPQIKMTISDSSGYIADKTQFIEGLDFTAYLGIMNDQLNEYLKHEFYFATQDLISPHFQEVFNGTSLLRGISKLKKNDTPVSKAYGSNSMTNTGLPLYNTIDTVSSKFSPKTKTISTDLTSIVDIFYQKNEKNETFLKRMAKYSYGGSPQTPMHTFFNLNNDFYFESLSNFFKNTIDPDCVLYVNANSLQILPNIMQGYSYKQYGLPVNEDNYLKDLYYLNGSGSYVKKEDKISNYKVVPSIAGTEKSSTSQIGFNILKKSTDTKKSIKFLGLQSSSKQKSRIDSKKIYEYYNTLKNNSLEVVIPFNKKCITGKLVEVQFKDPTDSEKYSKVMSGKWLIHRSEHTIETDKFTAWSKLYLTRPYVGFNANNSLKSSMIT
jgi:hypothetical protein